jgi:hypothetical protein
MYERSRKRVTGISLNMNLLLEPLRLESYSKKDADLRSNIAHFSLWLMRMNRAPPIKAEMMFFCVFQSFCRCGSEQICALIGRNATQTGFFAAFSNYIDKAPTTYFHFNHFNECTRCFQYLN